MEFGCLWCGVCMKNIRLNYRLWSLANFHRQLEDVKTTLRSVQLAPFRFARCNTLRLLNAITSNKNHIYKYPPRPLWSTVCFATEITHTLFIPLRTHPIKWWCVWSDEIGTQLQQADAHFYVRRNIILHRLIYSIAELSRLRPYWRLYFCVNSTLNSHVHSYELQIDLTCDIRTVFELDLRARRRKVFRCTMLLVNEGETERQDISYS